MPTTFQTCLLVSALACFSNGQVYLSLEDDQFHVKEQEHPTQIEEPAHEAHEAHFSTERLDHQHDAEDSRYIEEQRLRQESPKHFQEVHHPYEAYDYGSPRDTHDHYWHHQAEPFGHYANAMPSANAASLENVLDDEDPAICFVKAYARKPLGAPSENAIPSNALDWFDEDDDDYYDDYDYDGGYSDSEGYYDEEEEDNSMDDEEETSDEDEDSEEDDYDDEYDFGDDLWSDRHRHHYPEHAQFFDLANQGAPTPAPAGGSDSEDSQDSEEDDSQESSDDANAYMPHRRSRRRRGQGQGRGLDGRRTRRHPTGGRRQRQGGRRQRRQRQQEPLPVDPHAADPHASWPDVPHSRPHAVTPQPHTASRTPVHDRHAPPPSTRRHRRQQRQRRAGGRRQGGRRQQQDQARPKSQRRRKQGGRKRGPPTNDEAEVAQLEDVACPKFFEKTEDGCEKPLSLWRGNGQKKKCRNCQKCEEKWFPQCPPSFVVTECDVCAPVCPDGMIDHDGTCLKPGIDVVAECGHDEQLIDGECYRQCPGQTSEFDILCFGLCPMDMYKCGHTLCLKADQQCPQYVADKAINLDKLVEKYKKKDVHGSRLIDLSLQSMFPFPECH